MILLDTNAIVWATANHARVARLLSSGRSLHISPANLLEYQILTELGRVRLKPNITIGMIAADDRWKLDDPPASAWFQKSLDLSWARDPLDRLLVAHALYRGWRFATADQLILEHLRESEKLEL